MRVLNICMNAPFTENYSYQDNLLTEYQKKLGHEVTIITSTRTRDEQGRICYIEPCDKMLGNGVRLIRIDGGNTIQKIFGWYPQIKKQISKCQPQVIFIHGLCSFVPVQAISYKRKNRTCAIVADNHQDTGTTKVNGLFRIVLFIHRFFWKFWIKHVKKIYGTTSWRNSFAKKYYGIPEGKLDTLIMGIDSDSLPQDMSGVRKKVRTELKLVDDEFVFVTGGKLDCHKKIIETIRAFGKIENSKVKLLIFGSISTDLESEFKNLIEKDQRIVYLNYVDSRTIKEYFIGSDFGVFAGRHSVLWEEAIGCGLPCIFKKYEENDHTDVCNNCIRLEETTEDNLYQQMRMVLDDKEKYRSLKRNAEIAADTFSYYTIAKKSLECAIKY